MCAHGIEWCNSSVVLEGHQEAQKHFLRWLKKSEFPVLEVNGPSLNTLRKEQIAKARAPVATLVRVVDLSALSTVYNNRKPKHLVRGEFETLAWKGSIELNNPPAVKQGKHSLTQQGVEVERKKAKTEHEQESGEEWLDDNFGSLFMNQTEVAIPQLCLDLRCMVFANTSNWIVCSGVLLDVHLEGDYKVKKVVRTESETFLLLPEMPPGTYKINIDGKAFLLTVLSIEAKLLIGE